MNVFKEANLVTREMREKLVKGRGKLIWLTGISGSGKSTLGKRLEKKLYEEGYLTYFLDGDNLRMSINKDLGFSKKDREENIRRAGEISKILVNTGVVVIGSFISPSEEMREGLKEKFSEDFLEVYIRCSFEECKKRDVKGLYKKALDGNIDLFTGIKSEYEEPKDPDIIIDTEKSEEGDAFNKLYEFVKERL